MRALQCFLMEFWDMSTRGLEAYLPEAALGGLQGGWCVELPQRTRICHLRWCACQRVCLVHCLHCPADCLHDPMRNQGWANLYQLDVHVPGVLSPHN